MQKENIHFMETIKHPYNKQWSWIIMNSVIETKVEMIEMNLNLI